MKITLASVGLLTATVSLLSSGSSSLLAAGKDFSPSRFVYIVGEVKVPQRYVCTEDLTLGKAIKMAQGVTSKASDQVTLTRERSNQRTFKLSAVQKGDAEDVKLKPGDEVFVPRKK